MSKFNAASPFLMLKVAVLLTSPILWKVMPFAESVFSTDASAWNTIPIFSAKRSLILSCSASADKSRFAPKSRSAKQSSNNVVIKPPLPIS
ncbi:hypothetical protein D3C87_1729420 [compost metagenome]